MEQAKKHPSVADVRLLDVGGPWETKSGGELWVLHALPHHDLMEYFAYDDDELARIPKDIRGLRHYTVRNLPKGRVGGMEFHRIRTEIAFCLEGSVGWECEDVYGGKKELVLTPRKGIWIPPFILHTYHVLEEQSGLLVIANTLFDPEDPQTHDTYPRDAFYKLRNSSSAAASSAPLFL